MQDLQVRDVNKRLSRFLADLHDGYRDVYDNLSCSDTRGRIVSSSDAALIGQEVTDGAGVAACSFPVRMWNCSCARERAKSACLMQVALTVRVQWPAARVAALAAGLGRDL